MPMAESEHSVHSLDEIKLPWRVRRRLPKLQRAGRSGVLVHGIIKNSSHGITKLNNLIWVSDNKTYSSRVSARSRHPKWFEVQPGTHFLKFHAVRSRTFSELHQEFTLKQGQILVAICWPIQPWTIFGKSPETDRWYLGVR